MQAAKTYTNKLSGTDKLQALPDQDPLQQQYCPRLQRKLTSASHL